jgi:GNAT superfamily N-acetyltransferase
MVETYHIALETTPDQANINLIRSGLSTYNISHASDDAFTPLILLVRNQGEEVIGGLLGGTYWGWLVVEVLWIAESDRNQGLGSRLLERAEQIALGRGCHSAHLDTMSFQAPTFYQRHGYTVFGVLDDLPRGHQRIYLKKELNTAGMG